MAASLRIKQELIEEQQAENDRLLLTLMPEAVAKRYKEGEETIAEDHQDVSVVFADIVGFDAYRPRPRQRAGARPAERTCARLRRGGRRTRGGEGAHPARRLSGQLRADRAAGRQHAAGRRFRPTRCDGRAAFQRAARHPLELRAGVDTGTVTSGLVGRTTVVYDLWGDAVNLAYRVAGVPAGPASSSPGGSTTGCGTPSSSPRAGDIEHQSGAQPVWRVEC